jgi:hypothetical protein
MTPKSCVWHLTILLLKNDKVVVAGDVNVPHLIHSSNSLVHHTPTSLIINFADEHSLTQLAKQPTGYDALLDLIFVSHHFVSCTIDTIAPIGESDYNAQMLHCFSITAAPTAPTVSMNDYDLLQKTLRRIDWRSVHGMCEH